MSSPYLRINSLKTKIDQLKDEESVSRSLIDRIMKKINITFGKLEYEVDRPSFKNTFLSIVLLTDQLNHILLDFNLQLEDLVKDDDLLNYNESIIEKEPVKLKKRSDKQYYPPVQNPKPQRAQREIYQQQNNLQHLKSDEVKLCVNPSMLSPKKPKAKNYEAVNIPEKPATLTVEMLSKVEDQCQNNSASDISHRKVLDFLRNEPNQGRYRKYKPSDQKLALEQGSPGFTQSKFEVLKQSKDSLKNMSVSTEYSDLNLPEFKPDNLESVDCLNKNNELSTASKCNSKIEIAGYSEKNVVKYSSNELKKFRASEDSEQDSESTEAKAQIEKLNGSGVEVKEGDTCMITNVVSPSCFYIITASENIVVYDRFHEELQKYCESSNSKRFHSKGQLMASGSQYFCCKNQDIHYPLQWFRCIVVDWLLPDSLKKLSVRVLAVDDGFEKEVDLESLRDFPSMDIKMPQMACRCSLINLYPPSSTTSDCELKWPAASIDFFEGIVQNSRENPFTVCHVNKIQNVYHIDLTNTANGTNELTLCKVMQYMDYGKIIEPEIPIDPPLPEPKLNSEFMIKQIMEAQGWMSDDNWDTLDDCEANFNQAVANAVEGGYTPTDFSRLCKFTKVDGQPCFKGTNCKLEHSLPDKDGWTTDTICVYFETINQVEIPEIGSIVKITVTYVKSINRFYGHIKLTREQKSNSSNLVLTANQFTRYISKPEIVKKLVKPKLLPALGQLVLASSPIHGVEQWYRARVISINAEQEFEVFFIDYGDAVYVTFDQLREIEKEHLGLPEQAVLFTLTDVMPDKSFDFETAFKAVQRLSELILDQTVKARVINNKCTLEVDVVTKEMLNVSNYLKHHNLAKSYVENKQNRSY